MLTATPDGSNEPGVVEGVDGAGDPAALAIGAVAADVGRPALAGGVDGDTVGEQATTSKTAMSATGKHADGRCIERC